MTYSSSELLLALALLTFSWINVIPQNKAQAPSRPTAAADAKPITLTGTSFDERSFVSDADMKIWKVKNTDVLKGRAGEHVRITAEINNETNTITVKSIRFELATPPMPANQDDPLRSVLPFNPNAR